MAAEKELLITLRRSPVSRLPKHRATLEALGLARPGRTVRKKDNPQTRGMIRQVDFMIDVEEVEPEKAG